MENANKLKGTNISINEDFSMKTLAYRKELRKEVKQHRSEGRITYLNYQTIALLFFERGIRTIINIIPVLIRQMT